MAIVAISKCDDYDENRVRSALEDAIEHAGGLDFVTPGTKVAIKANLVSFEKPEKAATPHPVLICEFVKLLKEKGAEVVIGDSPGGFYNESYVNRVYNATKMTEAVKYGAKLNDDFSQKDAFFKDAAVANNFTYTAYLDNADVIIDFCKLKTHGMMGMTNAIKNMFGVIPGTTKPEYHFRFPNPMDFANMIIDLNEYFKPKVKMCICDAIVGMEGNGPTAGTPRHIGCVMASTSPYQMDLVASKIIGIPFDKVPILVAAKERGLITENVEDCDIYGDYKELIVPDYNLLDSYSSLEFGDVYKGPFKGAVNKLVRKSLKPYPYLRKNYCVGCKECFKVCPAKAITMVNNRPEINRDVCIGCFCCQEFCPKAAMVVKRPFIAKMLNRKKNAR